MCSPIIEFSQVVFIVDPDFHLVLSGYQPAWVMWYIALIPQALMLCLIYTLGPVSLGLVHIIYHISGKALEPVV